MSDKLIIRITPPRDGNYIPGPESTSISIQHDDEEPRRLTRVSRFELDLNAADAPMVRLTMYPHDSETVVSITAETAAAILKVEQGRSLHFLDADDRRAIEDLFASRNRTSAAEREALGKILVELDLRDAASSELH